MPPLFLPLRHCRHPRVPPALRAFRAFTLLELLVVLTLIAVVAGIALPNSARLIASFGAAAHWREVEADIDGMPFKAFSAGAVILLETASARLHLKSLPDDWRVAVAGSIRYRADGWCEGGRLTVTAADGQSREYRLTAPQCRIEAQ